MISAAMDGTMLEVRQQLTLPPGTRLSFMADSLGPPIPPSHKQVPTLVLAVGPSALSLHSLLPSAAPTAIAHLSLNQITASVPRDIISGYKKGLLQWIGLTAPQLLNVQARPVLLGARESVLIAGSLDGHLHMWLWDPLACSTQDACEGEEEVVRGLEWLGAGPSELDSIGGAWFCELHSERRVPTLIVASERGGLYLRLGEQQEESEWQCLSEGSPSSGPIAVTRYDHETLTICRAVSGYLSVSMLGLGGLLLDIGQLRLANVSSVSTVSWNISGERLLLLVSDAQQSIAISCALQDGTLIEVHRKRLPLYSRWAIYKGTPCYDSLLLLR